MRENVLRWFEDVLAVSAPARRRYRTEVDGTTREGRPKLTWIKAADEDRILVNFTEEIALFGAECRKMIHAPKPKDVG